MALSIYRSQKRKLCVIISVIQHNDKETCPKPRRKSVEEYATLMPYQMNRGKKTGKDLFWWTSDNYLNGNNLLLLETSRVFVLLYWYAIRLTVNWNHFWFASGRGQKCRKLSEKKKKEANTWKHQHWKDSFLSGWSLLIQFSLTTKQWLNPKEETCNTCRLLEAYSRAFVSAHKTNLSVCFLQYFFPVFQKRQWWETLWDSLYSAI